MLCVTERSTTDAVASAGMDVACIHVRVDVFHHLSSCTPGVAAMVSPTLLVSPVSA